MIKVRLARTSRARPGAVLPRGGKTWARSRRVFRRDPDARRHLPLRRRGLRFEGIVEDEALVTRTRADADPKIPSYAGGKVPALDLPGRARAQADGRPGEWDRLPPQVSRLAWRQRRPLGRAGDRASCWWRPFRAAGATIMVCYPFEGRLAHQTLGHAADPPAGAGAAAARSASSANDYAPRRLGPGRRSERVAPARLPRRPVRRGHARRRPGSLARRELHDEARLPALRDHRRADRAPLSGRQQKTGRQVTISTDLVYDVLRQPPAGPPAAALPRGPMRQPASSTWRAWARCWRASGAESRHAARSTTCRRSRVPVMLEIGKRARRRRGGRTRSWREAEADADRRGPGVNAPCRKLTLRLRQRDLRRLRRHGRRGDAATCPARCGWRPSGTLVVADLHLEKGSSFAARGQMLPPYDTRETLRAPAAEVVAASPRAIVDRCWATPSTTAGGPERLAATTRAACAALPGPRLVWVAGNHDADGPRGLGRRDRRRAGARPA